MGNPQRVGAAYLLVLAVLAAILALTGKHDERHGRRCNDPRAVVMSGRQVSATDLNQRKLRCADLEGATFDGLVIAADLRGANLHAVHLENVQLSHVDLSGADLSDVEGQKATMDGVQLSGADLRGAILRDGEFTDVGLDAAQLHGADLRAATFTRSDLRKADLSEADLRGASLTDSDLRGRVLGALRTNLPSDMKIELYGNRVRIEPGAFGARAKLINTLGGFLAGAVPDDQDIAVGPQVRGLDHAREQFR
jgi:uncharacterized protein YjbI with pentapeptide repeats